MRENSVEIVFEEERVGGGGEIQYEEERRGWGDIVGQEMRVNGRKSREEREGRKRPN